MRGPLSKSLRAGAALTAVITPTACISNGESAAPTTTASTSMTTTSTTLPTTPDTTVTQVATVPSSTAPATTTPEATSIASPPNGSVTLPPANEPVDDDAVRNAVDEYYEIYNNCAMAPADCDYEAAATRMNEAVVINLLRFAQAEDADVQMHYNYEITGVTIYADDETALVDLCETSDVPPETGYPEGTVALTNRTGLELIRVNGRWLATGILTMEIYPWKTECDYDLDFSGN